MAKYESGNVDHILRFGYILLTVTLILMIWSSLVGAANREIVQVHYPPCSFNPLCSCSKPAPDLGIVQCRNVPFPSIPNSVNISKVFMLHMERTGLRELEPYFFQATGLYRLEISYNLLTDIPDDSFVGLERSLWELMLQYNELTEIPSRAIRHLQKLRHIDLSGNHITCVEPDSFRGLEDSLQTLVLAKNLLNKLPPDSFSTLPLLDTIDLSGNNIAVIDANIFRDGMPRLHKLLLSDNILTEIPYIPIAPLKQLRVLDLSHNIIEYIIEPPYVAPMMVPPLGVSNKTGDFSTSKTNGLYTASAPPQHSSASSSTRSTQPLVHLTLDILHLEYNRIKSLPTDAFKNFDIVNVTYLDGNPLKQIADEAFRPCKIRELYIRFCSLNFVSPLAFEGLGATLQILDLSGNNISTLAENTFHNFDMFRVFNMKANKLRSPLLHTEMFNDFQFTLLKLDLSGEENAVTNLQELRRLRNLRALSISRLSATSLSPDDFLEFGLELEDLKITRGMLQSIKAHAFKHVRGIKRMDFSENQISSIDADAFFDVGHTLVSLKISHGLSGSMNALHPETLQHLTSLQELDVSNNQLKTISETCFHFMKNLRVLEMHDNRLDQVTKGTFQGDIHSKLEIISLGFNNIKHIVQHTFVDLEALKRLHLEDNQIEHVERRAFMNLDQLQHLSLRGNKLATISDEAFQIYLGDSFPQYICGTCESDVHRCYEIIYRFRQREQLWSEELRAKDLSNGSHHQIPASSNPIESSPSARSQSSETSTESILKNILLNRHIYHVKSLQQVCLEFFNKNGPDLLDTILYVPFNNSPDHSESNLRLDETQSVDIANETADDTSQTEDTKTEPDTNCTTVKAKKKRLNPIREYVYKRRRKRNIKLGSFGNGRGSEKESHIRDSPSVDADSESQDSISLSLFTQKIRDSAPAAASLTKLPTSVNRRSSERLTRMPLKFEFPRDRDVKPLKSLIKQEPDNEVCMISKVKRAQVEPFKKPNKSKEPTVVARQRNRSNTRVNYSEELVDEALMYEEILLDKEAREQMDMSHTIQQSRTTKGLAHKHLPNSNAKKTDSFNASCSLEAIPASRNKSDLDISVSKIRRNTIQWPLNALKNRDICIEPARPSSSKSLVERKPSISLIQAQGKTNAVERKFVSLNEIKHKLIRNLDSVLNINSSVSITLRGSARRPSVSKVDTVASASSAKPTGQISTLCQYCGKTFGHVNQLAVHQMKEHMRLQTHRVGATQILCPKLRRGRMVPVGAQKFFRCLNCWRLHANSQNILEHWVSGKCLFYCSICGQSFHENPKLLSDHFMSVHKIRYKLQGYKGQESVAAKPTVTSASTLPRPQQPKPTLNNIKKIVNQVNSNSRIPAKIKKSGRVTCEICSCSFPNMHSRNSHMRLHKNDGESEIVYRHHHKWARNQSQTQLKQLLQQKPKPFNFPSDRSQPRADPQHIGIPSITIKAEPAEQGLDHQFDEIINAIGGADAEFVDTDFTNLMTPLGQEILIEPIPRNPVKCESSEMPRIHIKKLTELQDRSDCRTTTSSGNSGVFNAAPAMHQPDPSTSYMHDQTASASMLHLNQQPPFQMSHMQQHQMPNDQYYNPSIYGAPEQQQQHAPPDPLVAVDQIYPYSNEQPYTDYSKFYS